MAGGAQASDDDIVGINVTPFVDIALVLLIIFLVTAKYLVAQSIPVDLPAAATGADTEVSAMLNVSVDARGQIFLDGRPATEQALLDGVRVRSAGNAELRAVINADGAVAHRRVTQVIDLVRQGGVTRFAIQTEQPGAGDPHNVAAP
ncbi:MAG: biopolymer transporter ExbD [Polyangiales bacterium]